MHFNKKLQSSKKKRKSKALVFMLSQQPVCGGLVCAGFDMGQDESMSYFHTGEKGYHQAWDSRCFCYR